MAAGAAWHSRRREPTVISGTRVEISRFVTRIPAFLEKRRRIFLEASDRKWRWVIDVSF